MHNFFQSQKSERGTESKSNRILFDIKPNNSLERPNTKADRLMRGFSDAHFNRVSAESFDGSSDSDIHAGKFAKTASTLDLMQSMSPIKARPNIQKVPPLKVLPDQRPL